MAFNRNTIIVFGLYSLAWTYLVSGKAIDAITPVAAATSSGPLGDENLPPLIFPTDKQRNNIVPINKTAIKILLHEDDLNSSSTSNSTKKEAHNETSVLVTTSGEADDLRKTDLDMATSEEAHAEYAKLHPLDGGNKKVIPLGGGNTKDQVENIQEVSVIGKMELEEQYNRPQENLMSVSIVNISDDTEVRHHLAWITVSVVVLMGLAIYVVLLLWRNKLEQRYGNRHRLFTDEDTL